MPRILEVSGNNRASCLLCSGEGVLSLSEPNIHFLQKRITEANLNDAIDICRIAWDQFPRLKESSDAKRVVESVLEGLQEKITMQVLAPISTTTAAMTSIIDRLEDLADSNPSLIEQGFNRTLEGLKEEMSSIRNAIKEPTGKISELNQLVNQLMYKPVAKGNAGETILTELWAEYFIRDQVDKLGGAGREDILVRPHLSDNGSSKFGELISVERKTGKQKFTGSHRQDAIRHAREKGAGVAMLVYDTQDNLPQSIRPVSISREQGILVATCDLQSGSWKMMRETIEIIQRIMMDSGKTAAEINVDAVQEVVTELANVMKLADQIKGGNAKIRSCSEEIEQSVGTIKALVKGYQGKLQTAILGINNTSNHNQIE
jgi:hypothetical protein